MGKKLVALITDDHDGKDLDEDAATNSELVLTVDGKSTVWDLFMSPENTEGLKELVTKYCPHAESTERESTGPQPVLRAKSQANPKNQRIRAAWTALKENLPPSQWARMELPDPTSKGRIPGEVIAWYEREHPNDKDQDQD